MRKALVLVAVSGLIFATPTPTRAADGNGYGRAVDIAEVIARATKAIASGGNPLDIMDAIFAGLRAVEGEMTRQQMEDMERVIKDLQRQCSRIPGLEAKMDREFADLRVALSEKADRKEVLALMNDLRQEMNVEFKKLKGRVRDLEKRQDKTEQDVEGLKDRVSRIAPELRGHLLLKTGRRISDVEMQDAPGKEGIRVREGLKWTDYKASDIESVTVADGVYLWDSKSSDFVLVRTGAQGTPPTPSKSGPTPRTASLDEVDAATLKLLRQLTPAEKESLKGYVARRGDDWNKLTEALQCNYLQEKLKQDYDVELKKIMEKAKVSEGAALRLLIIELAGSEK